MNKKLFLTQALLVATMLLNTPAFADGYEDAAPATAPLTDYSDIPVISGGIGEELDYLKSIQHHYNLKLLITESNGIFLSDVEVHIEDKQGNEVADLVAEGPIVLAKLPAGSYKIKATRHEDEVREIKVFVKAGKLNAYSVAFHNTDPRESGDPKTTSLQ